ncbi:MAG: (Fe-S)-binding protein [Candidatus Hodarchaeales archaeon]
MIKGSSYIVPNLELRKKIVELSKNNLSICYQCSSCTGICPLNMLYPFNPRDFIHWGQIGLEIPDMEKLWQCTTCGACESICPKNVKITEIVKAYRNIMVEAGIKVPKPLTQALESFYSKGNPYNEKPKERTNWAEGLDVPIATEETDVLYYVGCTASYDKRSQLIARSLAEIFNNVKLNWGVIGNKEKDCGNCIYFMGEPDLGEYQMSDNVPRMKKINPSIIVTTSPHSYNFIKNFYDLPEHTVVYHYSQYLDLLIKEGKIQFKDTLPDKIVTFQDPCYLGRHNLHYDEPRRVLNAIPGVKIEEMQNNREASICCGGGGGNVWNESKVEERLSIPRINEAVDTGASILTTCCYYCLIMFEDAVKITNNDEKLKVMDLAELVAEAIQK